MEGGPESLFQKCKDLIEKAKGDEALRRKLRGSAQERKDAIEAHGLTIEQVKDQAGQLVDDYLAGVMKANDGEATEGRAPFW